MDLQRPIQSQTMLLLFVIVIVIMNLETQLKPLLPARPSSNRQRWLCGVQACPETLATRGKDDKGIYLELPPAFDYIDKKGCYDKSNRPARRFNRPEFHGDNTPVPVDEAMRRIHHARNTDVQIRLRVEDLPAEVCCAQCKRHSKISTIAVLPR